MLLFTFVEYALHRFIFHAEKKLYDYKILRYAHFMMHGIHHMFPFDPERLVLPPPFTALVIFIGYLTLYRLIPIMDPVHGLIFWSSFLVGYVLYDSTHYFLHHLQVSDLPFKNSYLGFYGRKIF